MKKFPQKEKCVGSPRERQDFLGKTPVTYERSQGLLKGWGYSYEQPTKVTKFSPESTKLIIKSYT